MDRDNLEKLRSTAKRYKYSRKNINNDSSEIVYNN